MQLLKLRADPLTLHRAYVDAQPFPHAVIDNLFEDDVLNRVLDDFPDAVSMNWARFDNVNERKLGYYYERSVISLAVREFLDALNRFEVLLFLEELTGIKGLIPDPYFGGGGLHQIEAGGFLKVHADFNVHPKLKLRRRLNMLTYLNRNWKDEYGGHLELWDADMRACRKRIAPIFNRTVVFSTTDTSYHGHPHPLTPPPGVTRKSVSMYYYSADPPEKESTAPHDTIFREPRVP